MDHSRWKTWGYGYIFNYNSNTTCLFHADIPTFKQLLDEAMEKGYVMCRQTICLLIGAAGAGKSHVKYLVLRLPPPLVRQSTPLAEQAVRTISITLVTVDGTTTEWHAVTPDELKLMIVQAIKAGVPLITVPWDSPHAPIPSNLGVEPSLHTEHKADPEERIKLLSLSVPPRFYNEQEPVARVKRVDSQSALRLEQELIDLIATSSSSKKLLDIDCVYLIDSGGQPQFAEILPIFIRSASAAIFVSKLNEELGKRPTVEYYGEDGEQCGFSYSSHLTNEQILMHSCRAMQSRQGVLNKAKSPRLFIAGTHRDLEGTCSESRATKNEKLIKMLRPFFGDNLCFYHLAIPEELIFPVNAKTPAEEDRKVADELRRAVMETCNETAAKIPLPWFVLEQFVQQLAAEKRVAILSTDECRQLAYRLHMSEEAFQAALQYLTNLHIFLYYREWLPEVVFCNSQALLDKISELVQFNHKLQGTSRVDSADLPVGLGGEWLRFRDHGIVTVDFLKMFPNHYNELFTPSKLLKLLTGLHVTTQVAKGEYIMPCLLPHLHTDKVAIHRQLDSTAPLLVQYPDHLVPCGLFTLAITILQNAKYWLLLHHYGKPVCLYRNCVTFKLPTRHAGTVTLINSLEYLEVHVDAATHDIYTKACPQISHDIFSSLDSAAETLGYGRLESEMAFFCPQRGPACSAALHPALIVEDTWVCAVNAKIGGQLTSEHGVWLKRDTPKG